MKRSDSRERRFLEQLQDEISVTLIEKEIESCRDTNSSCRYITRCAYRIIPELREKNLFDDTLRLFENPVDRALLEGWRNAQAHRTILSAYGL